MQPVPLNPKEAQMVLSVEGLATKAAVVRTGEKMRLFSENADGFLPPWSGKFASDCFHPSQDGYRDWARALLSTLAPLPAAA